MVQYPIAQHSRKTAIKKMAITREAEALALRRKALETYLIDTLPASDADGICGKVTRATIKSKRVPTLKDWSKFTAFVKKTGKFELMQRRLSVEAVQEIWDAKKQVPGVEGFTVKKLSITKK